MKWIYEMMPTTIQHLMCSVKGYIINKRRYNSEFFKCLDLFERHKVDSKVELKKLLLAAQCTAYYQKIFSENNINIESDDLYAEIKKLPILDRETLVQNRDNIINKDYKGKTIMLGSSGTTAVALVFPCSIELERKQWAIWWRYRRALGLDFDVWCGWFGGKVVVPVKNKKSPFWRYNYPGKQVMFSAIHLNTDNIESYYNEIKKRGLQWLHGHAHNITYLASLIIEAGLPPLKCVKWVTTGSDSLFNWQRKIIKEAFCNSIVRQHYGLSEGVANISENKEGELIVDSDFGYVEFIPIDDSNLCKIIATGFYNKAFPLIRYDTGDLATIVQENGHYRIEQIDGRTVDCIKLPNGRRLSSTAMTYNFEFTTKVKELQFYQPDIHNIYVRIVKRIDYDLEQEKMVIRGLRERIPQEVNIHIEYVDKVERTKSGKIRYIISDIK